MKKLQNIISLLLVALMLVGMLPVNAVEIPDAPDENLPNTLVERQESDICTEHEVDTEEHSSVMVPPSRGGNAQFLAEDREITSEAAAHSLELYQNYILVDPRIFIWSEEGIKNLVCGWDAPEDQIDSQIEYVRQLTQEIVKDCKTVDEQIYAVMEYLAKNICYDYDHYEGRVETTCEYAYEILVKEYTVCRGYARTFEAMMQMIGIPCVYVGAPNHAWNMVYNGDRWMLIDVTWISGSTMYNGVKSKSDYLWTSWYDFTIQQANEDYNHTIEHLPYSVSGGVLEDFPEYSLVTEFAIPEGVSSIGTYAFYGCTGLASIEIPGSVATIGEGAFAYCTGLTSVALSNGVTGIGDYAFYDCTGLTSVTLSNGVTSIGDYAFCGCAGLTGIEIPGSVATIGEGAFAYCTGLTSIAIPDSVTSMGDYAFYDCTGLTSIELGDGLKNLDGFNFGSYPNLISLKLGNGITSIGDYVFYGCAGLTGIEIPGSVATIGEAAFAYCTGLTSVTLSNGVTGIGVYAFFGCTGLTSIEIPASVVSIGEAAFYDCTNLSTVYYKGTREQWNAIEIVESGNYNLLNARLVFVCDHTEEILPGTAATCTEEGLTEGKKCSKCSEILIEQKVIEALGHDYDEGTVSKEVGCTEAGEKTYRCKREGCSHTKAEEIAPTGHTEETIPGTDATLTEPGLKEGKKCTVCGEITVEQEVIPVLEFVGGECGEDLTWTLTRAGVLTISGTGEMFDFAAAPALQPQSVSRMSEVTLEAAPWSEYAVLITKVVIQDGVTSIGDNAFTTCEKLTEVKIPETVTRIGDDVFSGCDALETVTYTGSKEQWTEIEMGTGNELLADKLEISAVKEGDVNGDGSVNGRDTIIIATAIANRATQDLTSEQFAAADVNGDGSVNGRDTIIIATAIANRTTDEL